MKAGSRAAFRRFAANPLTLFNLVFIAVFVAAVYAAMAAAWDLRAGRAGFIVAFIGGSATGALSVYALWHLGKVLWSHVSKRPIGKQECYARALFLVFLAGVVLAAALGRAVAFYLLSL